MNRVELRKIFELMDTDRDGQISYEELKTGQNARMMSLSNWAQLSKVMVWSGVLSN